MDSNEILCPEEYKPYFDTVRLENAAASGNDAAALQLAEGYYLYNRDYEKCYHYLQQVKRPDLVDYANFRLAHLYAKGAGVEQDIDKAIKLFKSVKNEELLADCWCNRGVLQLARRRVNWATDCFTQAMQTSSGCYPAAAYRATIFKDKMATMIKVLEDGVKHDDSVCKAILAILSSSMMELGISDDAKNTALCIDAAKNGNFFGLCGVVGIFIGLKQYQPTLEDLQQLEQGVWLMQPREQAFDLFLDLLRPHIRDKEEEYRDFSIEALHRFALAGHTASQITLVPYLIESGDQEKAELARQYINNIEKCTRLVDLQCSLRLVYWLIYGIIPNGKNKMEAMGGILKVGKRLNTPLVARKNKKETEEVVETPYVVFVNKICQHILNLLGSKKEKLTENETQMYRQAKTFISLAGITLLSKTYESENLIQDEKVS